MSNHGSWGGESGRPLRALFFNTREPYAGKIAVALEACRARGRVQAELVASEDAETVVGRAVEGGFDVIVHRNEHGRLFADRAQRTLVMAQERGIAALSLDFGYFDHYKSFMVDYYRRDLSSSLPEEWAGLPGKVDWEEAPGPIRAYRDRVRERLETVGREPCGVPLGEDSVCVWMQWTADLLRQELYMDGRCPPQWLWLNVVAGKLRALGLRPVVKMNLVDHSAIHTGTTPRMARWIPLVTDKEKVAASNPGAVYDRDANWKLLRGCRYHVAICSSATNLMVVAEKPVIATGKSWFNHLGIFHEPLSWEEPFCEPRVNQEARGRWIHWWWRRQCLFEDVGEKLCEVAALAKAYLRRTRRR